MNDYDKAGRYFIKRDPTRFFRWLLRRHNMSFHAWIDARRLALPDQGDLTNDLVAAFRVGEIFEALCLELQAESEAGSASRLLLGYLPRLLTEPAAPGSLVVQAVGGVVINLTGPPQPAGLELRPTLAPDCWLSGGIGQRTLREEDAAELLSEVAAGHVSRWLLAWLPLLRGGGEVDIIAEWEREAIEELGERDRQILAGLTLTFADLAGCRAAWERALEGWNVLKSPYLEELREKTRVASKAEGRAEGRVEGRVEALRETVLQLGRKRFGKTASRKQKAQLEGLTDLAHLERLRDCLLTASSWAELLATP